PAHCTSGGKAMLACLDAEELHRRYPDETLAAVHERSIHSWPALVAELRRISRRGRATNFGESDPSIGAVRVVIRSGTREPRHALVVAAPLSRLGTGREAAALAPAVLDAA